MPSEVITVTSVCVVESVDVGRLEVEVDVEVEAEVEREVEVEVEVDLDLEMGVKGSHFCDGGGRVFALPLWLVLGRLEAG